MVSLIKHSSSKCSIPQLIFSKTQKTRRWNDIFWVGFMFSIWNISKFAFFKQFRFLVGKPDISSARLIWLGQVQTSSILSFQMFYSSGHIGKSVKIQEDLILSGEKVGRAAACFKHSPICRQSWVILTELLVCWNKKLELGRGDKNFAWKWSRRIEWTREGDQKVA